MSMYRIIDGGTVYDLDAVLSGDVTFSGRATDKPLADGTSVADHYVKSPTVINFSGVVSDVKTFYNSSSPKVQDWIKSLAELQGSGRTFTMQAADGSGMIFPDCVIESLSASNDQRHGRVSFSGSSQFNENDVYSYNISFSIKQIKRARRGRLVAEPSVDFTQKEAVSGSGVTDTPIEEKKTDYLAKGDELYSQASSRLGQAGSL